MPEVNEVGAATKETFIDVRSVTMTYDKVGHRKGQWFTIGRFDWTSFENMGQFTNGTGVDLNALRAGEDRYTDQKKGLHGDQTMDERVRFHKASYRQTTYLMHVFQTTDREKINDFWATKWPFRMITRVNGVGSDVASMEKKILFALSNGQDTFESAVGQGDFNIDGQKNGWQFMCYRTIDLVDFVVVVQAKKMSVLAHVLGKLYTTPQIGNLYSHYCIHPDTFAASGQMYKNDILPYVTIRLAVHDACGCMRLLKDVKNKWNEQSVREKQEEVAITPFFTTGTDDISIHLYNVSSAQLCWLYNTIINYDDGERYESKTGRSRKLLPKALEWMTTQIGILESSLEYPVGAKMNELDPQDGQKGGKSLQSIEQSLTDYYKKLSVKCDCVDIKRSPFGEDIRVLADLIRSLESISRNSALRQLCYILAGPIRGAVEKLTSKDIEESICVRPGKIKYVHEFVTGLVYLTEHIIRMEGVLILNPENRPLLFDIPVSLLEFDLAFADRCARYLAKREQGDVGGDKKEYMLLLMPCLDRNITIQDSMNEQEDQTRLLYVQVPLSLIYTPAKVLCSLLHEVAHHSGETTRSRKLRETSMYIAVAILIAQYFRMESSPKTIFRIGEKLEEYALHKDTRYLDDTTRTLKDSVQKFFEDPYNMERIANVFWASAEAKQEDGSVGKTMEEYYTLIKQNGVIGIQERIEAIRSLFSECYADITMVSLLKLNATDYLKVFESDYEELKNASSSYSHPPSSFCMLVERVGLVTCAFGGDFLQDMNDRTEVEELRRVIRDFVAELRKKSKRDLRSIKNPESFAEENEELPFLPIYVLDVIWHYLAVCLRKMFELNSKKENEADVKIIRRRYEVAATGQLASDDFFKEIAEYRSRIIP